MFLAGQRTTSSSPIIGQCFDTMIVASSDKEWLQWPIEIFVLEPLETVLSHLKSISRAVRTSGEATEDPLKLEFLSSFQSKCWTLNVVVLHDCSDYLTNAWWSLKTKNVCVFAIESQSEDESMRGISVLHTQMDICCYFLYISCHFLLLIDTRLIVFPEYCSFTLLCL